MLLVKTVNNYYFSVNHWLLLEEPIEKERQEAEVLKKAASEEDEDDDSETEVVVDPRTGKSSGKKDREKIGFRDRKVISSST